MNRYVLGLISVAAILAGPASAATPVIDNERVTVWDVRVDKGAATTPTPLDMDSVIMFLEGGRVRTTFANGKTHVALRKFGDALFIPKGSVASDTLLSAGPAHEIVIALKDKAEPPVPNDSGLPPAFPRPGSVKVLENPRVVVWHYSWKPGVPTPMHFHDKDVVVAYRYDGALKSVTPDGKSVVNSYKAGDIRFNKGNRAHYEELTTSRQSAVIMELK
jgi:predicted metal-dependent enzyme (double-stranded beta helix superfamily)